MRKIDVQRQDVEVIRGRIHGRPWPGIGPRGHRKKKEKTMMVVMVFRLNRKMLIILANQSRGRGMRD
jgi:hypothetical protein